MSQAIVNGILLGGLYAAIALGLSLVFGVLRLVNLAHGELLIGGAFLSYLAVDGLGMDPLLSLVLVIPVVFAIAYPVQRVILTPLLRRNEDAPLVATFGLSLLIVALLQQTFSTNPKSLSSAYSDTGVNLFGLDIRVAYLICFGIGVAMVVVTHLVLTRTRPGATVRAAAADPDTAAVVGINVNHLYAVTFGVAAAMAAIGGVMIGVTFSFTPTSGLTWVLTAFAVVVLGGIGSIAGTLLGGLALGLVESLGVYEFGGQWRSLIIYGLFFLALTLRPSGMLGRRLA